MPLNLHIILLIFFKVTKVSYPRGGSVVETSGRVVVEPSVVVETTVVVELTVVVEPSVVVLLPVVVFAVVVASQAGSGKNEQRPILQ